MSFSSETKNELAHMWPEKECCKLAEIAGFIRVCGSIGLEGFGKFFFTMSTDNIAVARHYKKLIKEYFDVDALIEIGISEGVKKKKTYILRLGYDQNAEAILRETGILMIKGGMNYISDGIYSGLIGKKCCRRAYLRGAFMGAGTITDPAKGHHLEIMCNTSVLAEDVRKLIRTFNDKRFTELMPKIIERKNRDGVYIKNGGQIMDMLSIMEAYGQRQTYDNAIMMKDLKNTVNRISNCDQANVDKAVKTAGRQIEAIKKLKESGKFDGLKPELQEIALLRLDYPFASLNEIGEMLDPPMGRSGLSKRFKKLEELAEKI